MCADDFSRVSRADATEFREAKGAALLTIVGVDILGAGSHGVFSPRFGQVLFGGPKQYLNQLLRLWRDILIW